MSITYTVALAQLRENLNEGTASTWSDAELLRYLYYGSKQVAQKLMASKRSTTIAVTLGTQTYTGPTDLILIHRVAFSATGATDRLSLELRAPREMDEIWGTAETQSRGDPRFISMWGKVPTVTIKLYPTPSRSGTLYVDYYNFPPLPATFSINAIGATAIDIPDGYEDMVITYAEIRARRRVGDSMWQEIAAEYSDALSTMENIVTRPHHDQAQFITADNAYMSGPWSWNPWY
jgi:hypothetical protein